MTPSSASKILTLLNQRFYITDIIEAGAVDAVSELAALANNGVADTNVPQTIFLHVPLRNHGGLQKIAAIKTLRIIFGLDIRGAKDLFENTPLVFMNADEKGATCCSGPYMTTKNRVAELISVPPADDGVVVVSDQGDVLIS